MISPIVHYVKATKVNETLNFSVSKLKICHNSCVTDQGMKCGNIGLTDEHDLQLLTDSQVRFDFGLKGGLRCH